MLYSCRIRRESRPKERSAPDRPQRRPQPTFESRRRLVLFHSAGIPSFYWGTNAIHGVRGSRSFPPPRGFISVSEICVCLRRRSNDPSRNGTRLSHRVYQVQFGNATSFPEPLNLAATFNRTVMRGVGRTIGREMRALFNSAPGARSGVGLTSWSPTINIIRDPRWGRNQVGVYLLRTDCICCKGAGPQQTRFLGRVGSPRNPAK